MGEDDYLLKCEAMREESCGVFLWHIKYTNKNGDKNAVFSHRCKRLFRADGLL